MKLRLLLVGRPRDPEAIALHDRYAERIRRLGVSFETSWVPDVRPAGAHDRRAARAREGRSLSERIGPPGTTIALAPEGELLSSEALAQRLVRWAEPRGTFVIGGPAGLDPALYEIADGRWSLSPLTLPHELVRVVVVEQLYRAITLVRGLPYHR